MPIKENLTNISNFRPENDFAGQEKDFDKLKHNKIHSLFIRMDKEKCEGDRCSPERCPESTKSLL